MIHKPVHGINPNTLNPGGITAIHPPPWRTLHEASLQKAHPGFTKRAYGVARYRPRNGGRITMRPYTCDVVDKRRPWYAASTSFRGATFM